MSNGPKEWTPGKIKKMLAVMERHTVDTAKEFIEDMRVIGGADVLPDNKLRAWHVTDNPEIVLQALRDRVDLQHRRPYGDICGGLYVSGFPNTWRSRSHKKWAFMETLSPENARKLAYAIISELDHDYMTRHITESEYERATNDIREYWLKQGNWQVVLTLASLPYAIDIQALARKEGVAKPFEPETVEVIFEGRYLNWVRDVYEPSVALAANFMHLEEDQVDRTAMCQTWRMLGWDGAYTKSSMGSNPELVIWNLDRILKFGSWEKGS